MPGPRMAGIFHLAECPPSRYRLELEVLDDIAEGNDHSPLPQALANIMGTSHTLEFKSHTYYEHNTYESFTCWRIVTTEGMGDNEGSSMTGVSRASKTPEFKRVEAEGSDAEASFVADTQTPSAMGGSHPDTRKIKRLTKKLCRDERTCIRIVMLQPAEYQECFTHCKKWQTLRLWTLYRVKVQRSQNKVKWYIGNTRPRRKQSISTSKSIYIYVSVLQRPQAKNSMWYEERINKGNRAVNPSFSLCYQEGKLRLPKFNPTPQPLHNLLNYNDPATTRFRDQIRVYISMFSFTSFDARIDHSINNGRGVYTFIVNGQSYHRIGSLFPKEGTQPRYAHLWFFDMANEVRNRMGAFIDKDNSDAVDATTVQSLIQMLDQYSSVAKEVHDQELYERKLYTPYKDPEHKTIYQAWERFKELLMKCPQHYLTDMQEVILFYNGLDVPTRQILDSRGVVPTKTAADAKTVHSKKWLNTLNDAQWTSRGRSTESSTVVCGCYSSTTGQSLKRG
ncbi:hypothetical protein Tco_0949313 [Tanacetum coccineum]